MNEGKKYPHEREEEDGYLSEEEKADLEQYNIAKGVYRGQFWSKNGWDPGDPDEYPEWLFLLPLLAGIGLFFHFFFS